MNRKKNSLVFISGATSGIGLAAANLLIDNNYELIVCGRRKDRLQELQRQFKDKIHAYELDVTKKSLVSKFASENAQLLENLEVIINNAGLAKGKDLFQDGSLEDFEDMIQTNVLGLIYTTRILLPFLIKNKKGHVVNIGSVAGRWVYQGGAVYCASKFSVQALTEGLRMDLYGWPIKVTNIQPGMVETEFSQVRFSDEAKAKAVYQGMTPLKAQDVAEAVLWCLNRPSHVNIQEVVMYPTEQYSPNHVWRGE